MLEQSPRCLTPVNANSQPYADFNFLSARLSLTDPRFRELPHHLRKGSRLRKAFVWLPRAKELMISA